MEDPFQISIRRLLVVVALFCIAMALFVRADHYYHDVVMEDGTGQGIYDGICVAGCVVAAAGIGTIFRKTFLCAGIVFLIRLVWAMLPHLD